MCLQSKIYAEVECSRTYSRNEAKQQALALATMMFRECLVHLGPEYQLSGPAEFIPDHVEIDLKRAFDTKFTPEFISKATQLARMEEDAMMSWLRTELKIYGGGSDPLQSMRPALLNLCHSQANEELKLSLSLIAQRLECISIS